MSQNVDWTTMTAKIIGAGYYRPNDQNITLKSKKMTHVYWTIPDEYKNYDFNHFVGFAHLDAHEADAFAEVSPAEFRVGNTNETYQADFGFFNLASKDVSVLGIVWCVIFVYF